MVAVVKIYLLKPSVGVEVENAYAAGESVYQILKRVPGVYALCFVGEVFHMGVVPLPVDELAAKDVVPAGFLTGVFTDGEFIRGESGFKAGDAGGGTALEVLIAGFARGLADGLARKLLGAAVNIEELICFCIANIDAAGGVI